MPKPKKGPRLGAGPADQKKILSNLAKSLIEHGSINTTFTRAKTLQPYIEKLITKAKKGDIHNRRLVTREIGTQTPKSEREFDAVYELFDVVVPQLDPEREGGYTRVVKIGNRRGDNAPMANISIIFDKVEKKAVVKDAEKTAKKAAADTKAKDADDVKAKGVDEEPKNVVSDDAQDSADAAADAQAEASDTEVKEGVTEPTKLADDAKAEEAKAEGDAEDKE